MKRRNFLKMLPVGLVAAKFGTVLNLIPNKIKSVPFFVEIKQVQPISGSIISVTINSISYPVENLCISDDQAGREGCVVYV